MTGIETLLVLGGIWWLSSKVAAIEANTPEGRRKAREERARKAALEAEQARQATERTRWAQAMAKARRQLPPPLPRQDPGIPAWVVIPLAWVVCFGGAALWLFLFT